MGQLEKYGLYVLCLVIFLILGVTIWGEGAQGAQKPGPQDVVPISANAGGGQRVDFRRDAPVEVPADGPSYLDSLLQPADRPKAARRDDVGKQKPKAKPADSPAQPSHEPAVKSEPAPQPQPVAATREYTVRDGDTISEISSRELGSTRYVAQIMRLNPNVDPRRIRKGDVLRLPTKVGKANRKGVEAIARAGAYRRYVIRKGDSFARIARLELGAEKRSGEIRRLNPDVDPRRLIPGKTLKLPLK